MTVYFFLFLIFLVAGFTQGVSMSGDLRDPARSLPLGTFLAVGLSFLVYVGVAIVFAGAQPAGELVADTNAMRRVSSVSWLVDAGVIAATLSSATTGTSGTRRASASRMIFSERSSASVTGDASALSRTSKSCS